MNKLTVQLVDRTLLWLAWGILCASLTCTSIIFFKFILPWFRVRRIVGFSYLSRWLVWWLIALAGIIAIANALFGSFIAIKVTESTLTLFYCWPRQSVNISKNQ